ncbi:protein NYNRIN-like [Takifugu flavidus]|uniref:protein NYNRIN-like n=1 Tax=Takifugu flavidus TaxID=433684 RepID=UPI0025442C14|nr:protein NYNRIN-like [Takifugu flavidus]XP_056900278.1 protein NYNRIN-like [Takifugu flavidus]
MGPNGKPCLPSALFHHYAKLTHGLDHASKGGMLEIMSEHWFTKGFTPVAEKFCKACVVCATHNPGRPTSNSAQAAHPPPTRPFEHVMMDFIELHPAEGKKFCLVFVDMWSKWVEAIPTSRADANSVARALLAEIIPRWGIPAKLSSDNGAHFVNEALTQISVYLGINIKRHCAYHPQSGGAVERENGSLKAKMAKCCEETGLPWPKVLPLALMYMRMRKRGRANLSPFEILFAGIPNSLSEIRARVKAALPSPADQQLHPLHPGDYVVIKDFRRTRWNQKRWQGPFQILLVTQTAVKVARESNVDPHVPLQEGARAEGASVVNILLVVAEMC